MTSEISTDNLIVEGEVDSNDVELLGYLDYRGPEGPEGPQGPQGYAIGYIKKVSGTSESGSTDTYEIHLNNKEETVCGTFSVYNGKDGRGAGDMKKNVYDTDDNGIVDNSEKVNNHIVEDDVPNNLNESLNSLRNDVDNNATYISNLEKNSTEYINSINDSLNSIGLDVNTAMNSASNAEQHANNNEIEINNLSTYLNNIIKSLGLYENTYDSTSTYEIGDLVVYDHTIYECNTAITTAEEWNENHWTIVPIIT